MTTNIYCTYVLLYTHNAFAHARNEILNQNTLQPKTAGKVQTLFQKFYNKETMSPPHRCQYDHYGPHCHHRNDYQ
jgi:hypothetical protein